jgi:hypothetical protein
LLQDPLRLFVGFEAGAVQVAIYFATAIPRAGRLRGGYGSNISSVCWAFSPIVVLAVDTGGMFLSLGESSPRVYACSGTIHRMHLARDYIHPYRSAGALA